jgi:hypothetical protein
MRVYIKHKIYLSQNDNFCIWYIWRNNCIQLSGLRWRNKIKCYVCKAHNATDSEKLRYCSHGCQKTFSHSGTAGIIVILKICLSSRNKLVRYFVSSSILASKINVSLVCVHKFETFLWYFVGRTGLDSHLYQIELAVWLHIWTRCQNL